MEIWIKKTESDAIQIPVNPSEYEITKESGNSTITIYGLGEISMLGKAKLKSVAFSSFFPNQAYDFIQPIANLLKPYEYVNRIEKWEDDCPVQLIITGTNINMPVTIENLTVQEKDGTGDVYYTVNFKAYRKPTFTMPPKAPSKSGKKVSTGSKKRNSKAVKTTKYTVKKGDTLSGIAKKKTGTSNNWRAIYNQNKSVIEATAKKHKKKSSQNGKWIFPGTKLVIKI
ncbi:LysM peptidoglycan-binding domain-containing protein [Anaerovorax odorimutans]|uniref:LysM peptidoglycan-binding domain-containing protein n=1 Tax=Anaerovorax odorimutans TaxID=109327 RepID=A0ABT1RR44_9FIRM|nr:LysM peptidoglycan-binding domain-containing protein [Anaerovorax odorimutans]MCQ4637668.1 LysM peptidoglycan-binding domain-containing protein [Anaerovorax odorimutans]